MILKAALLLLGCVACSDGKRVKTRLVGTLQGATQRKSREEADHVAPAAEAAQHVGESLTNLSEHGLFLTELTAETGAHGETSKSSIPFSGVDPISAFVANLGQDEKEWMMEVAGGVYFLVVFIFCSWFVSTDGTVVTKLDEVRKKREDLNKRYDDAAHMLSDQLQDISSSNAIFAEMSFQSHSRVFVSFLEFVNRDYAQHVVMEDATKFRLFLIGWLRAFDECSMDPHNRPRVILKKSEEVRIKSSEQLVQLLIQRTVANPITFLSELKQVQEHISAVDKGRGARQGKKAAQKKLRTVQAALSKKKRSCFGCCGLAACCCGCFSCCSLCSSWLQCTGRINCTSRSKHSKDKKGGALYESHMCCLIIKILSTSHMWLMLFFIFGIAFLGAIASEMAPIVIKNPEALTIDRMVTIVGALSGFSYTIYGLCFVGAIDDHARLKAEVERIEVDKMKVEKERNQINKKFEGVEELSSLWHQRTIPILDVYREVAQQFKDTNPHQRAQFLDAITPQLKVLVEGMGDLALWHGPKKLADRKLSPVAEQLKVVVQSISESYRMPDPIKYCADAMKLPGFLSVRVLACHDLFNKNSGFFSGGVSSPYVLVQVGQDGFRSFRTPTCNDSLNPSWAASSEEGGNKDEDTNIFPLLPGDNECTLEVWDDQSRKSMGFVTVFFREFSPGFWHRKREKLWSMRTAKVRGHGEIEYEIYFCTSVRLLESKWARSKEARASRTFRLSLFLADDEDEDDPNFSD